MLQCIAVCCSSESYTPAALYDASVLHLIAVCNKVRCQCIKIMFILVYTLADQCIPPYCSVLQCVAVRYVVLQHVAACCSVAVCRSSDEPVDEGRERCQWQCVAVCCSVWQCAAVCCSVMQWVHVCCSVSQCVAVCRSVLQCVAVCCSVLQSAAVCCSVSQRIAMCYCVL